MLPKGQVSHHIHFIERDGYDYTIPMTRGSHLLWHRLHPGTGSGYSAAPANRNYEKKIRKHYRIRETVMPNIDLVEDIAYNTMTGKISIISYFNAKNGKKIWEIKEK